MVAELEEFERDAERRELHQPDRLGVIRLPLRGRLGWLGVPLAAAAAVLLALLPQPSVPRTAIVIDAPPELEIAHWPNVQPDGAIVECFEPTATERVSVLAIFHRWHQDCQCMEWQLYEWEDGRRMAELSPDEIHDITIDVTDAPPVAQLLVVAVAKNPDDLPRDEAGAYELLDCLNDVVPPSDAEGSDLAYASAVQACLPESVRVVPQRFSVK